MALDPDAFDAFLAELEAAGEPAWRLRDKHRHPREVREAARAWRARERAERLAPLSDKVVYPRRLVDVAPAPKKGRGK